MFDSRLYRKVSVAAAALNFLAVAGCSNQPGMVASSQSAHAAAAGGAASKAAADTAATDPANTVQPLQLVTLPEGTSITATVEQTLASDKNHWGDPFTASLTKPVRLDGKTVLPQGTEVTGRVQKVKKHELKVVLTSVVVHGVYCDLATNSRRPSDKDQPKNKVHKRKKDNSKLSARTRLTFKLEKPATIPVKA